MEELLQVVCHFCNNPIRMVERTSVDQQEPILDQCDACSALPSNPEPPLAHLQYVLEARRYDCMFCSQAPADCECLFCPDCNYCWQVRYQTGELVLMRCSCGSTRRITLQQALDEGRGCLVCGIYPPNRGPCECNESTEDVEDEEVEATDEEVVDLEDAIRTTNAVPALTFTLPVPMIEVTPGFTFTTEDF